MNRIERTLIIFAILSGLSAAGFGASYLMLVGSTWEKISVWIAIIFCASWWMARDTNEKGTK